MTVRQKVLGLLAGAPAGMSDAALAAATGHSHQTINTCCRELKRDGIISRTPTAGVILNRLLDASSPGLMERHRAPDPFDPTAHDNEHDWFWEGNVQAAVCRCLIEDGWEIKFAARTELKERGTDIVAVRGPSQWHVEVKGYPSTRYADPRRAQERKRASPGNQAHHWYAEVVLAAIKLRDRHPEERVAIALPDVRRYHDLYAETAASLTTLRIELIMVSPNKGVILADDTSSTSRRIGPAAIPQQPSQAL